MASCLLHNLDDFDKADMQSAGVLLGLMPLALSFLSPTIGELALVSYRRPVLTCLMVIGAPAMSVTRLFKFTSIGDTLNEAKDTWPFSVRKRSPFKATIIVVIQYIWVALAVNNSLWNSVQLGKSTILSWKCLYPYMQLSWHFIPLAPFACATIALWRSKVSDCKTPIRIQGFKKLFIVLIELFVLEKVPLLIRCSLGLRKW